MPPLKMNENLELIELVKNTNIIIAIENNIFLLSKKLALLKKIIVKTKAFEAIENNWGFGEEHKKIIMGVDKINKENNLLSLLFFLTTPIKDSKPENCTKFPNCSELNKKLKDITISPEPDNKFSKLFNSDGNLPLLAINFATDAW